LDKVQEESNRYHNHAHKAEDEVDELCMAVHDLEQQLKVAHGLTVTVTTACAANKQLMHTPFCVYNQSKPALIMKPTYILWTNTVSKVLTLPQPPTSSMQPTDRRSSPAAADKDKDKEWPPPTPYTDHYSEVMVYNDNEYTSEYKNTVDEAKARDSLAY
jgi:hypothetical protein